MCLASLTHPACAMQAQMNGREQPPFDAAQYSFFGDLAEDGDGGLDGGLEDALEVPPSL